MRRWIAVLLLVVVSSFLATSGQDHCHDSGRGSASTPHILCLDDCAPAVIPKTPVPPPLDPLPKPNYEETVVQPILNLDLEPEKVPPRV
jgi:hypothetical protein